MTTTSTNQGLDTDSKPSSRVLRPPGGASSNIFGHCADDDAPQRTGRRNVNNIVKPESKEVTTNQRAAAGRSQKIAYNPITGELIEPAKPSPTKGKTEKEKDDEETENKTDDTTGNGVKKSEETATPAAQKGAEPIDHKSTRVSQPPGGRSSGPLW